MIRIRLRNLLEGHSLWCMSFLLHYLKVEIPRGKIAITWLLSSLFRQKLFLLFGRKIFQEILFFKAKPRCGFYEHSSMLFISNVLSKCQRVKITLWREILFWVVFQSFGVIFTLSWSETPLKEWNNHHSYSAAIMRDNLECIKSGVFTLLHFREFM